MSLKITELEAAIHQNMNDSNQVTLEASHIAEASQQALKDFTQQFEMSSKSMRAKHLEEISKKDNTIKMLVVVILILSACTISLGTKLIINKC